MRPLQIWQSAEDKLYQDLGRKIVEHLDVVFWGTTDILPLLDISYALMLSDLHSHYTMNGLSYFDKNL